MTHKYIYDRFAKYFPNYSSETDIWFPNGKNTIRVRLFDKREFIFRYDGENIIRFETVTSFLRNGAKNYERECDV